MAVRSSTHASYSDERVLLTVVPRSRASGQVAPRTAGREEDC